jgi:hypothetical protein
MGRRVGKIRIQLADKLNELFPDWHFEPENLKTTSPAYNNAHWDCCKWDVWGVVKDKPQLATHVHSYNTMTDCVKNNIKVVESIGPLIAEVGIICYPNGS